MKKILPVGLIAILFTTGVNAGMFGVLYRPANGIEKTGDLLQMAIPLSAFIYSAAISDWQGNWQLAQTVATTWATTEILKVTVREERPYQPESEDGKTFPSGHTSLAFAGAGYWQMRYGWYVGAPMYAAASFVGWSRVHAWKHNWTDVIAGAAIGIGFNLLFTNKYPGTKVTISPTEDGARLDFSTKF
jgi:membrane-associated phospholipid phosphatase